MRSSTTFLADLDRLREMEVRKRAMAPDDAERLELARAIEDPAGTLFSRSGYQRRLADEGYQQTHDPQIRHPAAALEDWRDAERRMMEARAALERASDDAARYQEEYRKAFTEHRDRQRVAGEHAEP